MYLKKTILLLSLTFSGLLFSQNVVEVPAKDLGMGDAPMPQGFFRGDDNELYRDNLESYPRENRAVYTLERYTESLKLKSSTKMEFPDDREHLGPKIFVGNKIFLFTDQYDGTNNNLYLRIIDKETGKILADKKQYGSLQSDRFGLIGRNFYVKASPDLTKLLIVSEFQWNKKPQVVNAVLYELPSLKVIDQYKFEDTYTGNLVKSHTYNLNSDGNLFYLFTDEPKDKDVLPKETVVLYDFKTKKAKYKTLQPSLKERETSSSFIKNNVLYKFGRYIEKISKKEQYSGTYCVKYDLKDIDKVIVLNEAFSADIDTKLSYKDGSNKKEFSKKDLKTVGVYQTTTGFYLVQNINYQTESESGHMIRVHNHSRDFIVVKFNFDGKREFVKVIPKNTSGEMYASDVIESGGNLFLFYCEHPKNLEKYTLENYDPSDYKDVYNITGPVPVCVKITNDGKLSRQTFERNEKWCFLPGYGLRLANGTQMLSIRVEEKKFTPVVFKIKN